MTIVVACGVEREAAVLGTFRQIVIPGGGDSVGLREKLDRAAQDAGGIISFGLGGALDANLKIGDWVIGTDLVGAVTMDCDADWIDTLKRRLPKARLGPVFSDGQLISTAAQKRTIAVASQALLVDMESHVAGAVARAHRLPFAILRCVSDEVGHTMPPAIAVAMRSDGRTDGRAMLASIAREPAQMPSLLMAITNFVRALRALKKHGPNISRPLKRINAFSNISRVETALSGGNHGDAGWELTLISEDYDPFADDETASPYRRFLEAFASQSFDTAIDMPQWTPAEDYVEGCLTWRGAPVRIYYETLLNFLTLWSDSRETVETLRTEIIRLAADKT